MNNEKNNQFIQNIINKYAKLTMNKQNRTKLKNELTENNAVNLYSEIITTIFEKKFEQQQNNNNIKKVNANNKYTKLTKNSINENIKNTVSLNKNEKCIKEDNSEQVFINEEKKDFSISPIVLTHADTPEGLELLKQRELEDTNEKYLLQKELMLLEKQILETFKFLIEDLFNEETLMQDREITKLLKGMYKEGLEQGMQGEFNVYQLESILRQINQSDPTSKLKAVIDIYQKFKGEQSGNTVNILNQAGEVKVGGASHKVFNELDQTSFLDMVGTLEDDLSNKQK